MTADPITDQSAVPEAPSQFYDSASATFPPGAQRAVLYFDGDYAHKGPPDPPVPFLRWMTVIGGRAAARAGIADYEPGNPVFETPGALRSWAELRITRRERAIVYSDRADLHLAIGEMGPYLAASPSLLWWIPTLDNVTWTPEALARDIAYSWHVSILRGTIWANQHTANQHTDAGEWDQSTLFLAWR
jgi:hypothetical protein